MASGMRSLAGCDGYHTAELALVDEFERGLGLERTDGSSFDARHSPLESAEEVEVFIRSLQLMSLADGRRSSREQEWLDGVCECLGVSAERKDKLEREARMYLLSSLHGVTTFRDQAISIGRSLGLSEEDIAEALTAPSAPSPED